MHPLSPELAKIAREELNETPERIEQDLLILRTWLQQQAYLSARSSEEFLIAFLRRCRYSLERTKKRIDKFFTYYAILPEIFTRRCVNERLLDINRLGIHYYPEFPKFSNQTTLLITRLGTFCRKSYHIREVLQYISMTMEIMAFENDNAAVAGICGLVDMSTFKVEDWWHIDPSVFKKFFDWVDESCPLRIRELYFLNPPKELRRNISMRSKLGYQPKKITLKMLTSIEELWEYVPKDCLPEEYGGTNGHLNESVAYMDDLLRSYRNYFEEDANYGVCEELRVSELSYGETEFGVHGTFRAISEDESIL